MTEESPFNPMKKNEKITDPELELLLKQKKDLTEKVIQKEFKKQGNIKAYKSLK